jgi:predicted DNA-binding protein with PD1-like motif
VTILSGDIKRVCVLHLAAGQDLLDELQRGVKEADIRHGAILQGVGSLTSYRVHVVGEKRRPVPNLFFSGQTGYDILSLQGYVLDGRVHAHLSVSDSEKAIGGHLERGCEVYTFALVTIAELEGMDLTNLDKPGVPPA